MKVVLLFGILYLISFTGYGQMILNQDGEAFTKQPFFNSEFIKNNKIKSLLGTYSFKKNNDMIRHVPGSYEYNFNADGRLISVINHQWNGKRIDTTVQFYAYNNAGFLTSIKKTENDGITLQEFGLDSLNRVISVSNFRISIDESGNVLKKTEMNTETMQYIKNKKTTFNSYNLPYMTSHDEYNEDGYKMYSIDKLKMGGTMYKKQYSYNEKGLVISIDTYYDRNPKPVESLKFNYDEFNNILERHEFKQGVFIRDLQVIFDTKTGLLYSIIDRNPRNNFMSIIRFTKYTYH